MKLPLITSEPCSKNVTINKAVTLVDYVSTACFFHLKNATVITNNQQTLTNMSIDLLRKIKELEEENKSLKADLSKEISDAIEFASQTSKVADSWQENLSDMYEEQPGN